MTTSSKKTKGIKARKTAIKVASAHGRFISKDAPVTQIKLSDRLSDIASDPQKATDFLKRAGIITKAGTLAPEYA